MQDATTLPNAIPETPARAIAPRWRIVRVGVMALAIVSLLAAWRYVRPHRVPAAVAAPARLETTFRGSGEIDARSRAAIASRIGSKLTEIAVEAGETVAAGQTLAILADDFLSPQADIARAQAAASEAAIDTAAHDLARAEAACRQSQQTHGRYLKLAALESPGITPADLEIAATALTEAEATRARSQAALAQARANATAARRNADLLHAQLAETRVTAPFGGIVTRRLHSVGDSVAAGEPLFELVDPATLVVQARFNESLLGAIVPGQAAHAWLQHHDSRPHQAVVVRLDRAVDSETRQFTAELALRAAPEIWALGERVRVDLPLVNVDAAVSIPLRLLVTRGEGSGVWILRDGRARWARVVTGRRDALRVEIVSGLHAGDTVLEPQGRYAWERVHAAEAAP